MNTKHSACGSSYMIIALVVLFVILNRNTYGWSVSGTVKSSSGTILSGVSVTVKDSAKYSTTTDTNGKFNLESPTLSLDVIPTGRSGLFSAKLVNGELSVWSPRDGSLKLSLVDCSGRCLWSANAVSVKGAAKAAIPTSLSNGVVFLQIRHANGTEYHSVGWGPDCLIMKPRQLKTNTTAVNSAAQEADYPTLLFKKTDYRDTSFSMTSENMTNVAVAMAQVEKVCSLPTTLKWQSSGILVNIKPDANHPIVSVKDPTIQKYNDKYLIYCTVYNTKNSTWNMQFIQFSDFSQADAVTPTFMDQVPGFSGYKCAPELFYYAPKDLWYLIWQQQDPAYSTTTTPDKPSSWSTPKPFFPSGIPNSPKLPIDYWPIADENNFYLFFTGDDGKVYRTKTTLANFPGGFGTPVVVKSLNTDVIFEGSSHYKIKGTANTYLHIVEGMGSTGRYYSAWTSNGIEGAWQDYKVGQSNPFARTNNVTFAPGVTDWSDDVSHGELLRDNPDQTQELDLCNLRFLYQGKAPNSSGAYELLPYRLGLLTAQ